MPWFTSTLDNQPDAPWRGPVMMTTAGISRKLHLAMRILPITNPFDLPPQNASGTYDITPVLYHQEPHDMIDCAFSVITSACRGGFQLTA